MTAFAPPAPQQLGCRTNGCGAGSLSYSSLAHRWFPDRRAGDICHVVDNVVATAGHAGKLIGSCLRKHVRIFVVRRGFLVGARTFVAMQTFAIVERRIEFDVFRFWNVSE